MHEALILLMRYFRLCLIVQYSEKSIEVERRLRIPGVAEREIIDGVGLSNYVQSPFSKTARSTRIALPGWSLCTPTMLCPQGIDASPSEQRRDWLHRLHSAKIDKKEGLRGPIGLCALIMELAFLARCMGVTQF
jgi:hypothetical protein